MVLPPADRTLAGGPVHRGLRALDSTAIASPASGRPGQLQGDAGCASEPESTWPVASSGTARIGGVSEGCPSTATVAFKSFYFRESRTGNASALLTQGIALKRKPLQLSVKENFASWKFVLKLQ